MELPSGNETQGYNGESPALNTLVRSSGMANASRSDDVAQKSSVLPLAAQWECWRVRSPLGALRTSFSGGRKTVIGPDGTLNTVWYRTIRLAVHSLNQYIRVATVRTAWRLANYRIRKPLRVGSKTEGRTAPNLSIRPKIRTTLRRRRQRCGDDLQ